jgi:hypothetical protein
MASDEILQLLVAERDKLTRAIEVLQGPTRRRGRPPMNLSSVAVSPNGSETPAPKKHTRTFTAAQRKKQAAAMRRYWAKKRKEAGKKG